jgi:membrane protein
MTAAPGGPGFVNRASLPTEPTPIEMPGFVPGFVGRSLDRRPVRTARLVLEVYGLAGGGLLAAGIAYRVLFAIAPAALLLVAVLGLIVVDEGTRSALIERLAEAFPPLADILEAAVDAMADGAVSVTIVSAAVLLWGASGLYLAIEEGIARMIPFGPMRDPARRTIFGLLAVVMVVGGIVALFVLGAVFGVLGRLEAFTADGPGPFSLADLLLLVGAVLIVTASYRFLPTAHPPWRAVIPPGMLAGLAIAALSVLYVFIAPRLAGLAFLYGSLAAVLVSLAWVGLVAQALLLGAAWTAVRWSRSLVDAGSMPAPDAG